MKERFERKGKALQQQPHLHLVWSEWRSSICGTTSTTCARDRESWFSEHHSFDAKDRLSPAYRRIAPSSSLRLVPFKVIMWSLLRSQCAPLRRESTESTLPYGSMQASSRRAYMKMHSYSSLFSKKDDHGFQAIIFILGSRTNTTKLQTS